MQKSHFKIVTKNLGFCYLFDAAKLPRKVYIEWHKSVDVSIMISCSAIKGIPRNLATRA